MLNVGVVEKPKHYHEAARLPKWQQAMQLELQALEHNNSWSLQPLSVEKHTIGWK